MNLRIAALLHAIRAELVQKRRPQLRMRFRGRRLEEEREVLADLRSVAADLKGSVLFTNRVVDEELAVKRLLDHFSANFTRLFAPFLHVVKRADDLQNARVRHIARVVHVLNKIVRLRPFDKNPARKLFKKSVGILVLLEEGHQLLNLFAHRFHKPRILRARRKFAKFHNEPHRPVRDVHAVVVIRRIAHRQHSVGNMFEALRQHEVFQKRLFRRDGAREIEGRTRRKEAVAKPARALAMRTVGENVDGVFAEGQLRGGVNLLQTRIGRVEGRLASRRIRVFAKEEFV